MHQDTVLYNLGVDISKYRSGIMGLSMIAIILFHQHFIGGFPTGIFHQCGYWGVDIFLLLSGMGMVNSLKKNTLCGFYKRRFLRLIPTCMFCGTLKNLILFLMGDNLVEYRFNVLSLFGMDLWFIRAIICYYAISPILFNTLRKRPILALTVISIIYFINGIFFRVHDAESFTWIIERLFVFSFGMYLSLHSSYVNRNTIMISSLSLCIALGIVITEGRPLTNAILWTIMMYAVALGSLSILIVGALFCKCCKDNILVFFDLFGKLSLELYLFHEFFFYWGRYYFSARISPFFLFIICLLLCIMLSLLCQKVISCITSFRK